MKKLLLPVLVLVLGVLSMPAHPQDWSQTMGDVVRQSADAGLISAHRASSASQVDQARVALRGGSAGALAAMLRWYKVKPGDAAYEPTKAKVLANLDRIYGLMVSPTFNIRRVSEGACQAADVWACADIGNTANGVRLQNLWFSSGLLCRNSVLVHETGHTIGLNHTPPGCGGPDCKATAAMTTAESLGNANSIAQFTEHATLGSYDSCSAGR